MNSEQLIAYLSQVLLEIIESIGKVDDLLNDRKTSLLIQSIVKALDELGVILTENVQTIIESSYASGQATANAALIGATAESLDGEDSKKVKTAILVAMKQDPTPVQKKIHLEAVQSLIDDTVMDMQAAIRTAKISAKTTILDTLEDVKETMIKGQITGEARKKVSAKVMEQFAKEGLTSFVTKDGKKLPLDFYVKTVVATKTRTAAVEGTNNRYQEVGLDLVEIDENSDTCPICSKYKGMVVSLSGKTEGYKSANDIKLPPYHPNCRGTTRPFVETFKSDKEIKDAKDKAKKWDPDKDTRTPAQRKAYEKEQEIRRKANEEKKQFMRWQSLLGAEAPKTLGAFRRMKRANTPKFQELQSMYRSKARETIS